jgi:hypothetical protein
MLLAAELTLLAIDPDSGRAALGNRYRLNACLAGLLVAELALDGAAVPGARDGTVVPTASAPTDPVLAAAAEVVADRGPKLKRVLSSMDRSLRVRLGTGTWDSVVASLVADGLLGAPEGMLRVRHPVLQRETRDAILARLRHAAASDEPLDARTALVLAMTGPANLLEVVAPARRSRKHARRRIDTALDAGSLRDIGEAVRRVLADAATAATVAATSAVLAGAGSSGS